METKKERNVNIELFRIFIMLSIVIGHYSSYFKSDPTFMNDIFSKIISSFTYFSVDSFVLISGWFYKKSITKISFRSSIKKAVSLDLKTIIYSLIFLCIYVFVLKGQLNPDYVIGSVIPFTCGQYWYLTAYILLLFAMPFLDYLINSINLKQHFIFVISIVCFIAVPSVIFPTNWLADEREGFSVFWFLCLYIIGAFLNKINVYVKCSKYKFLVGYIIFSLSLFSFWLAVGYLCNRFGISNRSERIYRYCSLPVLCSAICMIEFFDKIQIKSKKLSKIIRILSSCTFDVYIIHTNYPLKNFIYYDIFHVDEIVGHNFWLPFGFIHLFVTYFGCVFIGILFNKIFNKPIKFISDKTEQTVCNIFNFFIQKCKIK